MQDASPFTVSTNCVRRVTNVSRSCVGTKRSLWYSWPGFITLEKAMVCLFPSSRLRILIDLFIGRETYTFALVTQTGVPLKSAEKGSTQPVVLSCEEISIWLNTSERWDGPLSVLLSDRAELGSGLHSYVSGRLVLKNYQMTYSLCISVQVGKRITTSRSNTPSMIIPDVDRLDGIKASIGNILARDPLEPSTPARPPAMVALRMPSTLVSAAKEFSVPKRKRSKRKHPAPKPDTATDAGASSEDSLRSQKSRKHARVE